MNNHKCRNFRVCENYVEKSFGLCEECRKEAQELTRSVHQVNQEENLYVDKNEGLRRHVKPWNK